VRSRFAVAPVKFGSMPDYWITTHWPTPATEPGQSRHVFVKKHNVRLPKPGDIVFFRESIEAKVNGKRVRTATRHHRGQQARFDLPRGSGGIIGTATVDGTLRPIRTDDVVFDLGDLRERSVIPCRNFQAASLPLEHLLAVLRIRGVKFLSLWQMPNDERREKLVNAMRR